MIINVDKQAGKIVLLLQFIPAEVAEKFPRGNLMLKLEELAFADVKSFLTQEFKLKTVPEFDLNIFRSAVESLGYVLYKQGSNFVWTYRFNFTITI